MPRDLVINTGEPPRRRIYGNVIGAKLWPKEEIRGMRDPAGPFSAAEVAPCFLCLGKSRAGAQGAS